jgi:hypothetical protein
MTDDTDLHSVDEIFNRMLSDLHVARNMLSKAASPTGWRWEAIDVPLTPAQSQALTIASGAIDDAKVAIGRATGALHQALRINHPPRP